MQQGTRRWAFFLGGTFSLSAGLVAVACGTDNGTTEQIPTVDSGRGDSKSSSSGGSSSGDEGDGGTSSSGGSSGTTDCSKAPKPRGSDGPYCFSIEQPDGSVHGQNCNAAADEICCSGQKIGDDGGKPVYENSTCEEADKDSTGYKTGSCTGFTVDPKEYHCTEAKHCPNAGEICCAIPNDAGVTLNPGQDNDFKGCDVYYQSAKYVGGTRCMTSCPAGGYQLCSSDSECKNGKCKSITIDGRYSGYCRL